MPRLFLPSKLPELEVVSAWLGELSQVLSAIDKRHKGEMNSSLVASLKEENRKLKAEICGLLHLEKPWQKQMSPRSLEDTRLGPLDAVEHGPSELGPPSCLVTRPRAISLDDSSINEEHEGREGIEISQTSANNGLSTGASHMESMSSSFRSRFGVESLRPPSRNVETGVQMSEEKDFMSSMAVSVEEFKPSSIRHSVDQSEHEIVVSSYTSQRSGPGFRFERGMSENFAEDAASAVHSAATDSADGKTVLSVASYHSEGQSEEGDARQSGMSRISSRKSTARRSSLRDEDVIAMWPIWAANRQGRRAIYGATASMRKIGIQISGTKDFGVGEGNMSSKSMASLEEVTLLQHFVLRPTSMRRFVWDVFGGVLISYDLIMVPLTQFELPESVVFDFIVWLITIFWTCDILRQFFIGYEDKGREEMRPYRIARNYMSTWFIPDITIVLIDWLCIILAVNTKTNARSWHISKSVRALRILRTLRLVRFLKFMTLIRRVKDRLQSEYLLLATKAFYIFAGVILLIHYEGCYWYAAGNLNLEGVETTWLDRQGLKDTNSDLGVLYIVCIHWALGQSGLCDTDIRPETVLERLYTFGCSFVWLGMWIVAAAFFSNSIMQVRDAHRDQLVEEARIRRFLGAHSVSGMLTNAILAFYRNNVAFITRRPSENRIDTFRNMPENLRMEMHLEVYFPILRSHILFSYLFKINPLTTRHICHFAMSEHQCDSGQEICQEGSVAHEVYYILSGEFTYHPIEEENQNRDRFVRAGTWICEVVLWRKWVYKGCLLARAPSGYVQIHAQTFHAIMEEADAQGWAIEPVRQYAKLVTLYYQENEPDVDIWDNLEKTEELVAQAFKNWDGWHKVEQPWKAWAFQNRLGRQNLSFGMNGNLSHDHSHDRDREVALPPSSDDPDSPKSPDRSRQI